MQWSNIVWAWDSWHGVSDAGCCFTNGSDGEQLATLQPKLYLYCPLLAKLPWKSLSPSQISALSVSNYKTSQEFWRIKIISSLTKIIERNIKIYDIKLMYYKNITNKESNGTYLYTKCYYSIIKIWSNIKNFDSPKLLECLII